MWGNCKDGGRTHEPGALSVVQEIQAVLGENPFKGQKLIWEKDNKTAFLSGGLTYLKGRL